MDIRKVKKLIELLEESSLTEMEIIEGEESVRLSRGGTVSQPMMHHTIPVAPPVGAPMSAAPVEVAEIAAQGCEFWPLKVARELDDAILHLRLNEPELGTLIFKTRGDGKLVLGYDHLLLANRDN